jgi:UPF0716 protein FxsA
MRLFFLLFISIPIVEMWLLIEVGARIGALSTILLVFLTAAMGLALLRQQGLDTLLRVNQRMAQGQLPASEILEGVVLAVGGALLLTPGFITDAVGFVCLLAPTRKLIVAALLRHRVVMANYGSGAVLHASFEQSGHYADRQNAGRDDTKHRTGNTLDGDYRRHD